ncbi:unnamed protein product [Gongylonema pulchrum]|uniref:ADH_zinc_N domain-containing protein n=1 Tax=Gongylonema pulchrum TaxID=637853 RepID=A0A183EHL6_9BILA|nr:unnamed protein product [Gongylonema pulchrum]
MDPMVRYPFDESGLVEEGMDRSAAAAVVVDCGTPQQEKQLRRWCGSGALSVLSAGISEKQVQIAGG